MITIKDELILAAYEEWRKDFDDVEKLRMDDSDSYADVSFEAGWLACLEYLKGNLWSF